jgi:hypothetical protein
MSKASVSKIFATQKHLQERSKAACHALRMQGMAGLIGLSLACVLLASNELLFYN